MFEVVDAGGPEVVPGDAEDGPCARSLAQGDEGGAGVEPRHPAVEALTEVAVGDRSVLAELGCQSLGGPAFDDRGERVGCSDRGDDGAGDSVAGLGDSGPGGAGEAFFDRLPIEVSAGDRAHQFGDLGLFQSEHAHVDIALLRYSACPSWAAVGLASPARSAIVHASRSTRS